MPDPASESPLALALVLGSELVGSDRQAAPAQVASEGRGPATLLWLSSQGYIQGNGNEHSYLEMQKHTINIIEYFQGRMELTLK